MVLYFVYILIWLLKISETLMLLKLSIIHYLEYFISMSFQTSIISFNKCSLTIIITWNVNKNSIIETKIC